MDNNKTLFSMALSNSTPTLSLDSLQNYNQTMVTTDTATQSATLMLSINILGYIMVPLLFITGITGNLLIIFIMMSKNFRKYPVSCVLTALAISDTVVNLLLPFNRPFVRSLVGFDPRSFSLLSCKLFYFTYRLTRITSSWMVVIITTERLIAVCFPHKARLINTRRNFILATFITILLISLFVGCLNTTTDMVINGVCIPNYPSKNVAELLQISLIIGFSLYAFIPSIVLLIFNTMIVKRLIKLRKKLQSRATKRKAEMSKIVQTTYVLLGISFAFLLLVNPGALAHIASYIQKKSIYEASDTATVLLREITSVLEQANNSVNFFFYILGSAKFREHTYSLFCCAKCTNTDNSASSNGNPTENQGDLIPKSHSSDTKRESNANIF